MGRPKNKIPRTKKITLMLSEEEKQDIQYCADKLDTSRTDAIMNGINKLKQELENK